MSSVDPNVVVDVLKAVSVELKRATTLHPRWPAELWRQALVVREEMGEVDRAVLSLIEKEEEYDEVQARLDDMEPDDPDFTAFDDEANDLASEALMLEDEVDKEMVQVAAMALRFLICRRLS